MTVQALVFVRTNSSSEGALVELFIADEDERWLEAATGSPRVQEDAA